MKIVIFLSLFVFSNAYAVFDEECVGAAKDLESLFTQDNRADQLQDALDEAISTCRSVHTNLNNGKWFNKKLKKIEKDCLKAYGKLSYTGRLREVLECKVSDFHSTFSK